MKNEDDNEAHLFQQFLLQQVRVFEKSFSVRALQENEREKTNNECGGSVIRKNEGE